ncbi:ACP S-malonyltransferase, partial [bacterium]|nr:ACP S-malonyltransferase [bacterium]
VLAAEFKNKMPKQIYSSVHWTQTIENMINDGVDTFIEIGPGKVLAGLNRKINSDVKTYNIFDKDSLEATVNALKEEMAAV